MPELPEVETVRLGLERWCLGQKIVGVEVLHHRATNPRSLSTLDYVQGATIEKIARRGKFLWFELDRPFALVAHLGMSGQFRVHPVKTSDEKHLRTRFTISGNLFPAHAAASNRQELRFIDQRTFGWLAISEFSGEVPELVTGIARDIFDPNFERLEVIAKFRSRKTEIKRALLDQKLMSGVGNIYADESLWRAKIHPESTASALSFRKINSLLDSAAWVMSQALVEGGTSFDSLYTNVNGERGYFERSLSAYGREGEPCPRCGRHIRRIRFANRSSHFCPNCQRK
jgi:formamidopyrimidine-DNA glycosylase